MSHGTQPTVLLIEADASLRRLIALGLQYRGMHVLEASSPAQLPPLEAQFPSILILDVDGGAHRDWSLLSSVQTHPLLSALPIVALAWEDSASSRPLEVTNRPQHTLQAQFTYLTKPFDARTLHATIDQLLLTTTLVDVNSLAERSIPLQTATTAPSIWPIITAAALLMAFIGLMGFFAITILGLCIVLVTLLLWTLDTSPNKQAMPISTLPLSS